MNYTYSECVPVTILMQHATRMQHVILSSMACLAVPYFSTLSHKLYDLRGGGMGLLDIILVCWFSVQHFSEKFLVRRRIELISL